MFIEITKDIYQLELPFHGPGNVNSFLIKGTNGFTIVDTGLGNQETKEVWKKVIADGLQIEKVVLTHSHPDHMGLAYWFQKEIGIPVTMSSDGYESLKRVFKSMSQLDKYLLELDEFYFRHDLSDNPERRYLKKLDVSRFEPDTTFERGDGIRLGDHVYEAIWTPGHAPDHYCFWNEEERIMIVADHVLKGVTPAITISNDVGVNPLKDYFQSIERIETYPIKIALPGHGEHITSLETEITRIKNGHQSRLAEIVNEVKEGKTVGELCRKIYGITKEYLMMSTFSMTLSRLIYLESEGKVYREEKDGKLYFKQNN